MGPPRGQQHPLPSDDLFLTRGRAELRAVHDLTPARERLRTRLHRDRPCHVDKRAHETSAGPGVVSVEYVPFNPPERSVCVHQAEGTRRVGPSNSMVTILRPSSMPTWIGWLMTWMLPRDDTCRWTRVGSVGGVGTCPAGRAT